jgi:phosphate transport system permease protein
VPSVVFGLFGLALFVLVLLDGRQCVLAASLTLAVLILPVIIRASEEAIRSVPPAYKEAALALGASRLRCFLTVQLPAAMPGILTGLILSMSRAAGETAPILFTGAVAVGSALKVFRGDWVANPLATADWLFQSTRALSYGGYDLAVNDKVAAMVPHQQYGMVTTLVALVLLLNVAAILLRWRISRKLRGQ